MDNDQTATPADADQPQATAEPGQQIQLRVDERNMDTAYANAFRSNGTAEEVMIDFGFNTPNPIQRDKPEIVFQVSNRIIMNYYSAKRLALTLSQVVRRHEEQFGELEMDVAKRRKGDS